MGLGAPAAAPLGGGDSLMDLLGGGMPAAAPAAASMMGGGLGDLLGGSMGGAPMMGGAPASSGIPSITCWQKAGITVQMAFSKSPATPNVLDILMSATNANPAPAENFLFQIAVPKVKPPAARTGGACL